MLGDCFTAVPLAVVISIAILGLVMLAVMNAAFRTPERRILIRPFTMMPIVVMACALGWACYAVNQPREMALEQVNGKVGYGRIENLELKEQSMEMTVAMQSPHAEGCNVKITISGCNFNLQEGDHIAFVADFERIKNTNFPEDPDYALLQKRRGIIYKQHLEDPGVLHYHHTSSIWTAMTGARARIKGAIAKSGLNDETKHYIAALLLGDKKMLDQDMRTNYAAAGISHVLALSGMHIGIIMTMIWLLLWPLDYYGLKKLRFVLSVLIIVVYDMLTGMPPSAVRATIMIGFTFGTFIFGRKAVAVNSLLASALVILAFTPEALFDVGFQLSYTSVLAMLVLRPSRRGKGGGKRWVEDAKSLLGITVIATGATLALTAYYFHTISWMGVFTNVLIVPIFPAFMGVAVLITLLACAGIYVSWLNEIAEFFVSIFGKMAECVAGLPFSHAKEVYCNGTDVVVYFVAMALLAAFIRKKRWAYMSLCIGVCALGVVAHAAAVNGFSKKGCVMFSSFERTPLVIYQNGKAHYWLPRKERAEFDKAKFRRLHQGYFAAHSIDAFSEISDTAAIQNATIRSPFAIIFGKKILMAEPGKWRKEMPKGKKTHIDYCIIPRHFNGKIEDLHRLHHIGQVVISGSIHDKRARVIKTECTKLGLKYIDLKEQSLKIE